MTKATGMLAAGNAANRALGMAYRILISRFLGAEGLGLLQMAMSLYFAVAGPFISSLPAALSQVIAGYRTEGIAPQTRQVVARVAVLTLGLVGLVSAVLMLSPWTPPGESWSLAREMVPLPLLVPAMAFAVVSASLRGVFFGRQHVGPVVVTQLLEQTGRLLMLGALVAWLATPGADMAVRLRWVLWNLILGEGLTCWLLAGYYRRALAEPWVVNRSEGTPPRLRAVLALGMPIGLQRACASIERLVEAALIPALLQQSGATVKGAVAAYGELTGMVMPLLYTPNVFVHALTHTLVPGVAEVRHRPAALHHRMRRALQLTADLGAASTLLLIFTGGLITQLLFGADPGAAYPYAGRAATLFAPMAAFLYIDHVAAAVLRGLGNAVAPLVIDLTGLAVRLGLLLGLARFGQAGLPGVATALIIAAGVTALLNVTAAAWYARLPALELRPVLTSLVCAVGGWAGGQVTLLAIAPSDTAAETIPQLLAATAALVIFFLIRLGAMKPASRPRAGG